MRKPLMFLLLATLLLIAAAAWAFVTTPFVMGGKEIVAFFRPEALPLLYGAVALFVIALVVAILAAFRTWLHGAAAAETPAPPEETAPAID